LYWQKDYTFSLPKIDPEGFMALYNIPTQLENMSFLAWLKIAKPKSLSKGFDTGSLLRAKELCQFTWPSTSRGTAS
jgi:hypothetical protein